jgi:hypothetical protein
MVLYFSGRFHLTAFLRRRRISVYIYLFTVTILFNYTSVFREIFDASTQLRINTHEVLGLDGGWI